ncbi:TolC family protein [soil metagenome]
MTSLPRILPLTLIFPSLLFTGCVDTFKKSYTEDSRISDTIDRIMTESEERIQGFKAERTSIPQSKISPGNVALWWQKESTSSLKEGPDYPVSLESLYIMALQSSTQIKVFSDIPLIRETGIQEAKGEFDLHSYVEAQYERTNDPIGSILQTGFTQGRFKQDEYSAEAGLKKKIATGGEVSLSQEVGTLKNNSTYLVPNPQANARLKLSVVQPLLKGAGVAYNRAIMDIAKIDSDSAMKEMIRQAESHLLEISRSYWSLNLARVTYLQKRKLYEQALTTSGEIKARADVDAVKGQMARAESAVAERRADLVRAELAISNAQDRIRALVNSPELADIGSPELIPTDRMIMTEYKVDVASAAKKALAQRPEISQAFLQVRAAAVRERMQRNEVLPTLNLILEGYMAGLEQDYNTSQAYSNQYSKGGPGGAVGLHLDFPIQNNVAEARHERRLIELRQQVNQLRTTIETALLEVKVSDREVRTSWRDYTAKLESVKAAEEDLAQFQARKDLDTQGKGEAPATSSMTTSYYLDSLLNSQKRLSIAEEELAAAAATYQVSIMNYERSQGNLLNYEDISIVRTKDNDNLPLIQLQKNAAPPAPATAK